jgi:hypothetical protein
VETYLIPCLYESGNLSSELGIDSQMSELEDLGDALNLDLPTLETNILTVEAYEDFITDRLDETYESNTTGIWDLQNGDITCTGNHYLGCLKDLNDITKPSAFLDEFQFYSANCAFAGTFTGGDIDENNDAECCITFDLNSYGISGIDFETTRYGDTLDVDTLYNGL